MRRSNLLAMVATKTMSAESKAMMANLKILAMAALKILMLDSKVVEMVSKILMLDSKLVAMVSKILAIDLLQH
jgi:hypothetical protein